MTHVVISACRTKGGTGFGK